MIIFDLETFEYYSVISIWNDQISLGGMGKHQIWSKRCESERDETGKWLEKNLLCFESNQLKMRPIGDNTPYHELKEKWLDEYINSNEYVKNIFQNRGKSPIEFVIDSDKDSIEMWKRREVFVFDCNQKEYLFRNN